MSDKFPELSLESEIFGKKINKAQESEDFINHLTTFMNVRYIFTIAASVIHIDYLAV